MSPTMSSSTGRRASRSNGRPCCSAPLITATFSRSSLGGAISRPLNMAGSIFSKPLMSRICSQSCWAENPRDAVAGLRALQLQPGIGPAAARNVIDRLSHEGFAVTAFARFTPPAAAFVRWPGFCRMIERLRDPTAAWQGQFGLVREWYQPQLERLYDYAR